MGKVVLYSASSIDQYIARQNEDVDWLFTDGDYGYSEFYQTVDTLIMGNRTYRQILSFGEFPYSGKRNYVISRDRSLTKAENVEFITEEIVPTCKRLIDVAEGVVWLVGGGQINGLFLQEGLIDQMILSIHPIILANGIPLFGGVETESKFKLIESRSFPSGLLQVTYDFSR